jgi:membrane-associated protease RseP (regulator of RpoE activity)
VSEASYEVEIIGPDGVPVGAVRPLPPPPQRIWLHLLLLGLTLVTTTLFGALAFADVPPEARGGSLLGLVTHPAFVGAGLAFSLPLLLILLVHEMGHYLACRHHRLDATLPYFLPVPFGIGTFGAFIRIRGPLRSKRELLDVGAAGPLAGFVVALPVLLVGIALSQPTAVLPSTGVLIFGEPLAFKLLARLIHPELAAGGDLYLHPTGFAAWFGLFATALNLLPFGQLDGGHVTYALFGRLQRVLSWPLLVVLVALGFQWTGWWLWAVIALVMGVRHPWMPDQAVPLDPRRRLIGWACLALFALCFTPEPIKIIP